MAHLLVEAIGNRSGGGGTVLLDFLQAAIAREAFSEITVLTTPAARRSFAMPEAEGLRERPQPRADRSVTYRALLLAARFDAVARRLGADVVFSMNGMAWAPSLPLAILVQQPMPFYPEAASRFRMGTRARFKVIGRLMKRACRAADLVFVQTQEMQYRVSEQFRLDPKRFSVQTPCAVPYVGAGRDAAVAEQMLATPADRRLLYVGSDAPHKNLPLLFAGIGLIREVFPGAKLFATLPVGHPAGRVEGVQCLGVLASEELATAYGMATIVCLASLAETVGLPLVEAMSAGVPVLAADRAYAHEICGDAAGYFDPVDPASFAGEAVRMMSDGGLVSDRCQRGLAVAETMQELDPYGRMVDLLVGLGRGQGSNDANRR